MPVQPGLVIHRSERADPLVDALAAVLSRPAADPFAAEVVAVPSRGVERWLAQRLGHVLGASGEHGRGDGVCANVRFPSSNRLLDDALAAADPAYAAGVDAWAAGRAVWPLLAVLDEATAPADGGPRAAALAAHLAGDRSRRFAVAAKLAGHFAAYSVRRPGLLLAWRAGDDAMGDGTPLPADLTWQAELWRALREQLGPSPAELLGDACARLRELPDALPLPERVSIFGATRISPARVAALDALAAGREVHLWLHHPSPALWDAVAAAAPGPGRRADDVGARLVRHPLLASLSRDVRELQQLLPAAGSVHHPLPPRPDTLLGRIQAELAADRVPAAPTPVAAGDDSLTVHACHGPARQVEVVREVVLGLLRDDPDLEPRNVLVMCPDVETFAPLVAAAFGMADEPGGHPAAHLRVRLADRSLRQTNPLLSLLGHLLELGARRVTATELLDVVGSPAVRRRFRLTDDDVERLRGWTTTANARWGLDAEHRAPYGLGGLAQGTWRSAVDRLLLGVAMEEDAQSVGDVLPLDDVDSGDIDLAGRFAQFVAQIDEALRAFEHARTVPEWAALLADTVLAIGEPVQPWQALQLRSELDDLADAARDTEVTLTRADVAALVAHRLAGRPTRASFRTGTLTVCTLVPMRSVPHRVVCLLGMDDDAFPRHGVADGDDVLARDPRTGERDLRSEDRQLFLDAICAAQDRLVITYTGADPRSGAAVPPCVPLGELLDAVDATACGASGGPGRDAVTVHHPLQPFDARNFRGDAPFSFDPLGLAGARAAAGARHPRPPLLAAPLPAPPLVDVDLDELIRFLKNPAGAFLRQRLGVSTWDDDDDPADSLAVALDGLEKWGLGDRLLRARLAGRTAAECVEIEHLRGDLPPGRLGRRVLQEVGETVEVLLAACAAERELPPATRDVSLTLDDGRRVTGTVTGLRGTTVLAVTYSSLGAKQRIEAWVRYLALVAATGDEQVRAVSVGRRRDDARRTVFAGLDPRDARGVLAELVALRDLGLREPLPMAIKTSESYAAARHGGDDPIDARFAARRNWETKSAPGSFPQEDADASHVLVHGERVSFDELTADPPRPGEQWPDETTRFAVLARRLWHPVLSLERVER